MRFSKAKVVLLSLLLAAAGGGAYLYIKYRSFSSYLIEQISTRAEKQLGRRVKFTRISFSVLKGITIAEPCISRVPDFSKGNFFCAKRAVIRPELTKLLKNQVYFANIELDSPEIKLREAGGEWDFSDLLALLPKTSKGLHLTWNAKRLALRNAKVELDMASSGRSLVLEKADITLLHYSAVAGNFELAFRGLAKTILNGQLLTATLSLDSGFNFEYAGLVSSMGRLRLTDASLGASTLKKAALDWELFGVGKPASEKNYKAGLEAEGLLIPAQDGAARSVIRAVEFLSKVTGKAAPRTEDIEMDRLALDFALNDGVLRVRKLDIDSNLLEWRSAYELDGPARAVDLSLSARLGGNKFALTAKGPMDSPELKPEMSYTLSAKIKEAVRALNAAVLKKFPVVTEKNNV